MRGKVKPAMLTDIRKIRDAIGKRAGWKAGEIRSKSFLHTYTAARLQTTDRGEPVSLFTVTRELGHGGDSLVKRVYGHLGTVRHRAEHVEFRVEHHRERLADRLPRLRVA
jgi:integrase